MNDLTYGNIRASSLNVYVREYPAVPAAKEKIEEIDIPGRDGIITVSSGHYETKEMQVDFNYLGKEDMWNDRWREIQEWLSEKNTKLIFQDDANYYFKVSHVELGDNQRPSRRIGNFTATFKLTDALYYLRNGEEEYAKDSVLYNPYLTCHPVYKINGNGIAKLTVNGKTMKVNAAESILIDTERMLCYNDAKQLQNTRVSGDYKDLYLESGNNLIEITPGFEVKIIPNWRRK